MKKFLSKTQVIERIEEFFSDIKNKTPKEIKKIKRLAMAYNLPLKEKRKLFCKKCFRPYIGPRIRIKKGFINIRCEECGYMARLKIKKEK